VSTAGDAPLDSTSAKSGTQGSSLASDVAVSPNSNTLNVAAQTLIVIASGRNSVSHQNTAEKGRQPLVAQDTEDEMEEEADSTSDSESSVKPKSDKPGADTPKRKVTRNDDVARKRVKKGLPLVANRDEPAAEEEMDIWMFDPDDPTNLDDDIDVVSIHHHVGAKVATKTFAGKHFDPNAILELSGHSQSDTESDDDESKKQDAPLTDPAQTIVEMICASSPDTRLHKKTTKKEERELGYQRVPSNIPRTLIKIYTSNESADCNLFDDDLSQDDSSTISFKALSIDPYLKHIYKLNMYDIPRSLYIPPNTINDLIWDPIHIVDTKHVQQWLDTNEYCFYAAAAIPSYYSSRFSDVATASAMIHIADPPTIHSETYDRIVQVLLGEKFKSFMTPCYSGYGETEMLDKAPTSRSYLSIEKLPPTHGDDHPLVSPLSAMVNAIKHVIGSKKYTVLVTKYVVDTGKVPHARNPQYYYNNDFIRPKLDKKHGVPLIVIMAITNVDLLLFPRHVGRFGANVATRFHLKTGEMAFIRYDMVITDDHVRTRPQVYLWGYCIPEYLKRKYNLRELLAPKGVGREDLHPSLPKGVGREDIQGKVIDLVVEVRMRAPE
jgi:hypothetical protein